MRQRFAIWFVLPCLCLAWPSIPDVCAQITPLVLPADPEAAGVRRDVKTAKQAEAAKADPQQEAKENAAPAEAAPPAAPAQKLDKYNDAHSNAMRQFKKGFVAWPKLLLILLLVLIWVRSCDWINQDTQIYDLGYGKWNPIELFPFLAILLLCAFPILFGLANFWVAFGLLFVC